jgi:hypothetical protein
MSARRSNASTASRSRTRPTNEVRGCGHVATDPTVSAG